MPTAEYNKGFRDAVRLMQQAYSGDLGSALEIERRQRPVRSSKPKRKLSAWNKFVKANSKKKIYQFASGKLKLKKMGIAFRKTRAGRKK